MKQDFVENNIIILSKQTLDVMLKDNHPSDLMGLYCFYYYTAKWQKTNIVKCTTGYVMRGLKWTKTRVIENKKALKRIKLIEDKITKNKKGQITGWYIKLNYVWKRTTIKNQRVAQPEGGSTHPVGNPATNALSVSNRNALSAYKRKASSSKKKKKPYFDDQEMRWAQNKWWVLPADGGEWLEFVGLENSIEWR